MPLGFGLDPVVRDVVGRSEEYALLRTLQCVAVFEIAEVARVRKVIIERGVGQGLAAIGVLAVSQIDVLAEVTIQDRVVVVLVVGEEMANRLTVDVGRQFALVQVHEGRHEVDRGGQTASSSRVLFGCNSDHGYVNQFLEVEHVVLRPVSVLTQQVTVIGRQYNYRVLPGVQLIHFVEQFPEPDIRHGQSARIALPYVFDSCFILLHGLIVGPVEVKVIPRVLIHIAIFFGAGERLVRVKTLDVKVPVVRLMVVFEEVDRSLEALWCRVIQVVVQIHELAIDPIGASILAFVFRNPGIIDKWMPDIPFLAAQEFPAVESGVITFAAAVEVMVVVGDHVGVDVLLPPQFRLQAVIPRLDRGPGCFQEVAPAGIHLPSGRHAGHGAAVVIVEDESSLGEPVDVGCPNPRVIVVAVEVVAVERVEGDKDGSQMCLLLRECHAGLTRHPVFLGCGGGLESIGKPGSCRPARDPSLRFNPRRGYG